MPGQVLETSLIRPLSEFLQFLASLLFLISILFTFSVFFLRILFFPFGVPLLEINQFFYIARSAALTAFIRKMSLFYDKKNNNNEYYDQSNIITIILIKVIIIKLEEQKNFMVLGKKDLTKDLMATLVWFWMEIKKYTDVLRYIFFNI